MKVFFLQYPLSLIGTSKITLAMKEMDLNVGAFAGLLTPLTVTYGYRADGGYYPPKGAFVYASERKQVHFSFEVVRYISKCEHMKNGALTFSIDGSLSAKLNYHAQLEEQFMERPIHFHSSTEHHKLGPLKAKVSVSEKVSDATVHFEYAHLESGVPKSVYNILKDYLPEDIHGNSLKTDVQQLYRFADINYEAFPPIRIAVDSRDYLLTSTMYIAKTARIEICYLALFSCEEDDWIIGALFAQTYQTHVKMSELQEGL